MTSYLDKKQKRNRHPTVALSSAAAEDDEDHSKRSKFNGKGKPYGLSSFASKDEGKAWKGRYAKQRLNLRGSFAGHFFFSKHMEVRLLGKFRFVHLGPVSDSQCDQPEFIKNATMTGAPDMELDLMKVLNNWING
ncbi:hypothetical protein H0E87_004087 [Populus deltoides]|uniref:Uncharacterized protein n=1 Tax=Populus deltoides TaxID=3696 RepID=A0A8T2ZDS1_POPDE|nr:hypothetical protein H0E87_004087 [Populus deltoides]